MQLHHHHNTIYFENVHFFHAVLGLHICPYKVPPHIPEYRPFRLPTRHFMSSFTHSLKVFLFLPLHLIPATVPPPHFYRPTPNHLHSYAQDAQTTSICQTSPHLPHSEYQEDYKSSLHFQSFSNTTHPSHHHTRMSNLWQLGTRSSYFNAKSAEITECIASSS